MNKLTEKKDLVEIEKFFINVINDNGLFSAPIGC